MGGREREAASSSLFWGRILSHDRQPPETGLGKTRTGSVETGTGSGLSSGGADCPVGERDL